MSHRNTGDRNNSPVREGDRNRHEKCKLVESTTTSLLSLYPSEQTAPTFFPMMTERQREREKRVWINGTFLRWIEFSSQSHGNHGGDDDDDYGDDNDRKFCMTRRLALALEHVQPLLLLRSRSIVAIFLTARVAITSFAKQSCSTQKRTVGKSVTVDVRPIARLSRNDQRAWYIKSPFNGNARFPMNS